MTDADLTCPACKARGEVSPACDRCRGTGEVCQSCLGFAYVRDGDDLLVPCQACRVVALREMEALAELDGLKGNLLGKTFEGFVTDGPQSLATEAYNAAAAWAADPDGEMPWLFVHGTVGNGKTHLAAAAVNSLRARGRAVLFINAPAFFDWLRASFDSGFDESVQERMARITHAPLLVVDDIGAEKQSEWTVERSYLVVNERYVTRRPTFWTTNVPPERLDARVRSRLLSGKVVQVAAPDYRRTVYKMRFKEEGS